MNIVSKLTVFFEDPFWIGTYERSFESRYEVSRIVFGPEPKDYEVYDFINQNFARLKFTDSMPFEETDDKKINPKRLQRKIKKQIENVGTGTMAQQAIKLQYESNKLEREKAAKEAIEEIQERKYYLKMQKKKQKHRGH